MKNGLKYLLFAGIVFTYACSTNARIDDANGLESYFVYHPLVTDTTYFVDYISDITAIRNVEIRSRVKGFLEKIYIDEGQYVEKGQILFAISNQEYQEELLVTRSNYKSAMAELRSAELDLKNTEKLFAGEVVSNTEVLMAKARVEAAQAKVEMAGSAEKTANLNLSYTNIKAPFSGVINRIHYRSGSLIDESNLLTSISDNKEVFAYFNVSENEYLKYISEKAEQKSTDSVELILSNGSIHPFKGFIETIEGQFDNVTGNIAFRARFVNPERILKHGSSGKIRIYRPLKNAMLIPQKSTFELQDKIFVYTVDEDNKIQMTSCVPQFRIPHFYIIGSGLERDHLVIYEGIQELSVGTEVKPVKAELSALIARGITDQN